MVTKINNILPFQTNKDIIQMLINEARWKITSDTGRFEGEERNTDVNKMLDKNINNAGFSHVTFDRKFNLHIDTPFNLYGDIIFYTIKNKLKTIKTLHRIYWNYYDTSSKPALHKDELEDGYYWHELIGMKVINLDGDALGEVIAINNYGSNDMLEVKAKEKKLLIPFVKKAPKDCPAEPINFILIVSSFNFSLPYFL